MKLKNLEFCNVSGKSQLCSPFSVMRKVTISILNRKSKKQLLPSISNIGEQELSDPTQIAEQFCKYFTNIGPSLASNIPVSQKSPHSFLSGYFANSLFFEEVSE